jgi:hypothetical protein
MYRLNNRAFDILRAEVQKCSGDDEVSKTERQIVMKRLEKLRLEKGSPAKLDELRDAVMDVFPQFNEKVLKEAEKANQPPSAFSQFISNITWIAIFVTGAAGVVWFVNLPYPMIRRPVAEKAPMLLLPSFLSMDRSYRGAISELEQAEQLLNKATSPADIERGAKKAKEAQKHLDNLPVWFLGYYPQAYCGIFGCTWKFTFDEFNVARQRVAKLEAIAFQGTNALAPLVEAEKAIARAKKQYEQANNIKDRELAIAAWQSAINQLDQTPKQTLAGETAQTKLKGYKQEFEYALIGSFISAAEEFNSEAEKIKVAQTQTASELWQQAVEHLKKVPKENPRYLEAQKLSASYQVKLKTVVNSHSSTYIEGAKKFAFAAAKLSQNPPHPATKWEQVEKLWQKAINQLEKIDVEEPGYIEAQEFLAQYQTNFGIVQTRRQLETEAQKTLQEANAQIQTLIANPPSNPQQLKAEIQGVINQLKTIKTGTTAYAEAQKLLSSAEKRLKQ